MMRTSVTRNLQLIASLLLLGLLIVFALLQGEPPAERPFDLDSAGPGGLRALRLWLEEMGYTVEQTGNQTFALDAASDLLFVYPNAEPYTEDEALALERWVAAGHTLVLIGPERDETALQSRFGVQLDFGSDLARTVAQQQPLLPEADAELQHDTPDSATLDLAEAPQAVPVLAQANGPTVAVQALGEGTIWVLSLQHTLTNQALGARDQAMLVPALLRTVPSGGQVLFDTYHLYGPASADAQSGEITSLQDWLYRTPLGWATLFGLGATLIYLFLQGWRLGPALPARNEVRRREAAEYVQAMAALHRRAHQSEAVAHHHKRRLKLNLGRTLRINPTLPDREFVQRLQENDATIRETQVATISHLLHNLDQQPNEGALVRMVAEIDQILTNKR